MLKSPAMVVDVIISSYNSILLSVSSDVLFYACMFRIVSSLLGELNLLLLLGCCHEVF